MAYADNRFDNRRRALASDLAAQRIDALLVTNLIHVRYLTGFSGSNAALLVGKDRTALIATDGRYTTQVAEQVPEIEAIIARPSAEAVLKEAGRYHRIGFESEHVTVAQLEALTAACPEDSTLVPVAGAVEKLRLIKGDYEIEALADIAALATQAMIGLLDGGELATGRHEFEVAADLEYRMRALGAERPSFDTIVASGPNSAKPHHGAGDRVIQDGDLVTIDFGAHRAGFNSDMTRTFVMGRANSTAQSIYSTVLRAQRAGIEAARPGTPLVDVDKACRDIITDAGYGKNFVHSTGHGIGLEVHEGPSASTSGEGVLQPGMTLTIEPGIYVPGRGGVRIEDTLVITEGAPRVLTSGISTDLTVV